MCWRVLTSTCTQVKWPEYCRPYPVLIGHACIPACHELCPGPCPPQLRLGWFGRIQCGALWCSVGCKATSINMALSAGLRSERTMNRSDNLRHQLGCYNIRWLTRFLADLGRVIVFQALVKSTRAADLHECYLTFARIVIGTRAESCVATNCQNSDLQQSDLQDFHNFTFTSTSPP